jgi:hypothetical protein
MASFADLSFEGSASEYQFVLHERERHAETMRLWIDVLQAESAKGAAQSKASLRSLLASDKRLTAEPSDSWAQALRQTISQAIEARDDTSTFAAWLAALKVRLEQQRSRALRHKAGKRSVPSGRQSMAAEQLTPRNVRPEP